MKLTMLFVHLMLQVVVNNVIDLLVLLLMKLNKIKKIFKKKKRSENEFYQEQQ
jgi:hypothetical protein